VEGEQGIRVEIGLHDSHLGAFSNGRGVLTNNPGDVFSRIKATIECIQVSVVFISSKERVEEAQATKKRSAVNEPRDSPQPALASLSSRQGSSRMYSDDMLYTLGIIATNEPCTSLSSHDRTTTPATFHPLPSPPPTRSYPHLISPPYTPPRQLGKLRL
jgi:hypothetical protein